MRINYDDYKREKMKKKMKELFGVRIANGLMRYDIYTLDDLEGKTYTDLMSIRTIGKKSIKEIAKVCSDNGINLINDIDIDTYGVSAQVSIETYNKLKKYAELNNIPIDAAVKRCIEVGIQIVQWRSMEVL